MGAEVGLREGDGDGGVGWEIELGITLAPVSVREVGVLLTDRCRVTQTRAVGLRGGGDWEI